MLLQLVWGLLVLFFCFDDFEFGCTFDTLVYCCWAACFGFDACRFIMMLVAGVVGLVVFDLGVVCCCLT